MMKSTLAAITFAALTLSGTAMALNSTPQPGMGFNGPAQLTSVAELLEDKNPFTERHVIMEGNIIRQINQEKFVFTDGQNEINIELDDDIRLPSFDHTTKVRIFGEYEGGLRPELEVEHLVIL